jgi:inner membrane protein
MTTIALTLYFRGILKNKAAYLLGIFVALFYAINFVLLQLENFALLFGTLILFMLLSTIMYFTRNSNIEKEEQPQKEALP